RSGVPSYVPFLPSCVDSDALHVSLLLQGIHPMRSRTTRTIQACRKHGRRSLPLLVAAALSVPLAAQQPGNPYGEWRYWGADLSSTRYSPLDQINAENFESLEVAWIWRGDN